MEFEKKIIFISVLLYQQIMKNQRSFYQFILTGADNSKVLQRDVRWYEDLMFYQLGIMTLFDPFSSYTSKSFFTFTE